MKGEIIKKIDHRGFGFIQAEDSEDEIFFHFSELKEVSFEELKIGQKVEFEIKEDPRGPQASDVKLA